MMSRLHSLLSFDNLQSPSPIFSISSARSDSSEGHPSLNLFLNLIVDLTVLPVLILCDALIDRLLEVDDAEQMTAHSLDRESGCSFFASWQVVSEASLVAEVGSVAGHTNSSKLSCYISCKALNLSVDVFVVLSLQILKPLILFDLIVEKLAHRCDAECNCCSCLSGLRRMNTSLLLCGTAFILSVYSTRIGPKPLINSGTVGRGYPVGVFKWREIVVVKIDHPI